MKTARTGEKRKYEILDAAEELFNTKGYEKATINDILDIVNIGKGTLYYYYKSKEEILNAIIQRKNEEGIESAKQIATDERMTAHEKLFLIMFSQNVESGKNNDFLESTQGVSNAQMHQKILTDIVTSMSPILKEVVLQGIKEGVFKTAYPEESMEFLLATVQTIFDETFFTWDRELLSEKVLAYVYIMERVLGAREGSFSYIAQLHQKDKLDIQGGKYTIGELSVQ